MKLLFALGSLAACVLAAPASSTTPTNIPAALPTIGVVVPEGSPTGAPVHLEFALKVDSSTNSSIDGKYLTLYHEGAGINYAFAAGDKSTPSFTFNGTVLAALGSDLPYAALIDPSASIPVLEIGILENPGTGAFQIGYGIDANQLLTVNGSSVGWASCIGIDDPYHYPEAAIAFFSDLTYASNCEPVAVRAVYYNS